MQDISQWKEEFRKFCLYLRETYPLQHISPHPQYNIDVDNFFDTLLHKAITEEIKKFEAVAQYKADNKYESAIILMLSKLLKNGEEIEFSSSEILNAKDEWVVLQSENLETFGTKFKLLKIIKKYSPLK